MIYKKVPAINNKVISDGLNYTGRNYSREQYVFKNLMSKHSSYALKDGRREQSLWELIKLYTYFSETQKDNPEYQAYLGTMEEILFQDGLITQYQAGLPMDQFINRAIERLAAEALMEVYPQDAVEVYSSKGEQDYGVDLIWNGQKVDVKATRQKHFLSKEDCLGSIKEGALRDTTKKTELILWTGNLVHLGFISLIGTEKWVDVKEQIEAGEIWSQYYYRSFDLPMNKKQIKELNGSERFPNRFLGGIPNSLQKVMVKKRGY